MRKHTYWVIWAPCAFALCGAAQAGADHYNEAVSAYKGEARAQEPDLVNAGYYANRAVSTARRNLERAGVDDRLEQVLTEAPGAARGRGGDVNVASPHIYGTVRGNVTVVVQRGALRGAVTSVRR